MPNAAPAATMTRPRPTTEPRVASYKAPASALKLAMMLMRKPSVCGRWKKMVAAKIGISTEYGNADQADQRQQQEED